MAIKVTEEEFPDPVEVRPFGEYDVERATVWPHLTEVQATAMSGGYVPNSVKGVLRELLDYRLIDETRAERPIAKPKRRRKAAA